MGFIRGITLEDHPLRPAKMLVTGTAGGSAGVPDSLGHKPVDTSGRTAWSAPSHASLLVFLSSLTFPRPLFSLYYLFFILPFIVTLLQSLPVQCTVAGARPGRPPAQNRQQGREL